MCSFICVHSMSPKTSQHRALNIHTFMKFLSFELYLISELRPLHETTCVVICKPSKKQTYSSLLELFSLWCFCFLRCIHYSYIFSVLQNLNIMVRHTSHTILSLFFIIRTRTIIHSLLASI